MTDVMDFFFLAYEVLISFQRYLTCRAEKRSAHIRSQSQVIRELAASVIFKLITRDR